MPVCDVFHVTRPLFGMFETSFFLILGDIDGIASKKQERLTVQ